MESANDLTIKLRETRNWTPENWVNMSLESAHLMFDAADEIDKLHNKIVYLVEQEDRYSNDALRLMKERNEALDEIELARSTITDLRIEIERLRKERDEARREACGCDEYIGGAMLEAELRGWDCFKEDGK